LRRFRIETAWWWEGGACFVAGLGLPASLAGQRLVSWERNPNGRPAGKLLRRGGDGRESVATATSAPLKIEEPGDDFLGGCRRKSGWLLARRAADAGNDSRFTRSMAGRIPSRKGLPLDRVVMKSGPWIRVARGGAGNARAHDMSCKGIPMLGSKDASC